ncbi:MAG: hypothetical protein ACRD1Z_21945 [Vicinamibacteria bacterium]
MTTLNLLWPQWADVVARLQKKNVHSWKAIQRAAALLANSYGREQDARFAHLAWEEKRAQAAASSKRCFESKGAWARPPHRIRYVRYFLALVLTVTASSSTSSAAEPEKEKPGRLYQALGWATFAGSAGDVLSTEYALSASGARELNPLQQHIGLRVGSNVAFPLAANYMTNKLREDGHPRLALWCRVAVVALKGYAIAHNLREGMK